MGDFILFPGKVYHSGFNQYEFLTISYDLVIVCQIGERFGKKWNSYEINKCVYAMKLKACIK